MSKIHALREQDELPVREVPAVGAWSENYAFYGYDYATRTGFTAFTGRWVRNPMLWREQFFVYLPDGTLLSHRAIGPARVPEEPSVGPLRLRCEAPGHRWHIAFQGAMRHDTVDALMHEPILEARPWPVEFEATLNPLTPAVMMEAQDNSSYGRYHYEQGHHVEGHLRFDGQKYDFQGVGYRDHSRGPRKLGTFDGHIWLQLFLPNDEVFASYLVWSLQDGTSQQILNEAMVLGSGGARPAKVTEAPRLTLPVSAGNPVALKVCLDGKTLELEGKPVGAMINSFTEDFDFYTGLAPTLAEFMSIDQPVHFNSPVGPVHGWLQRSMRINSARRLYK